MKKKLLIGMLFGLNLFILIGCTDTSGEKQSSAAIESEADHNEDNNTQENQVEENNTSNTDMWSSSNISKELNEQLKAEAEINLPEGFQGSADILSATRKRFEEQVILEELMSGEANIQNPAEGVYYTEQKNLNIGNYLNYSTADSNYYSSVSSNLYRVKDNSLTFMNIDEAYVKLSKELEKLGISNATVDQVYGMDSKYLQEEEEVKKQSEYFEEDLQAGRATYKGEWSEEDGCYVFELKQTQAGIPILNSGYATADDTWIAGGKIMVYYSNNGLESIDAQSVYEVIETEEAVEIMKPEEALERLSKKYETIIMTDNIVVSDLTLIYIPVNKDKAGDNYRLVPAWDLTIEPEVIQEAGEEYHVYFNAYSGEELIQ